MEHASTKPFLIIRQFACAAYKIFYSYIYTHQHMTRQITLKDNSKPDYITAYAGRFKVEFQSRVMHTRTSINLSNTIYSNSITEWNKPFKTKANSRTKQKHKAQYCNKQSIRRWRIALRPKNKGPTNRNTWRRWADTVCYFRSLSFTASPFQQIKGLTCKFNNASPAYETWRKNFSYEIQSLVLKKKFWLYNDREAPFVLLSTVDLFS